MNLQHRIDLLAKLGEYMLSDDPGWQETRIRAGYENGWFIPGFVEFAAKNIAGSFLQKDILTEWAATYKIKSPASPLHIGIVMAGNIPLVGFHDLLCVFISGHYAVIKTSSKDDVLIKHLVGKMQEWNEKMKEYVQFAPMLKGCDGYIATGSNNSSRYFDYYFGKYPHIIRRNRTSVAVLTGHETREELEKLADDVFLYFGMGCRNATKIYVPSNYDFVLLLEAFKKYSSLQDHHKYKNNYDYNLALHLLNKNYYMTNGFILLIEDTSLYSPISQLNYEFYTDKTGLISSLEGHKDLQCTIGQGLIPFGTAQSPAITDYADGVDTLKFLVDL